MFNFFLFFRFGSARRQRKEINLSVVLLCIVLVFFCCHACRIIVDIYEFINMQKVEDCKGRWSPPYLWEALYPISNVFKILNSSLNFFVYCLVGHTFRRELCRTLGLKVRYFSLFILTFLLLLFICPIEISKPTSACFTFE